jgi:N-acetylglucosaminyldiphosphoundecaprenol N-acetyl-beta-D-mannosaminyltransferase
MQPTAPRDPSVTLDSASILGLTVHAVSREHLLSVVQGAVATRTRLILGNHNLNSLSLCRRNNLMRDYYDICNVVYADGMPVVVIAKALGYPFTRKHRITALDFIDQIFADAVSRGWRVFYLGTTDTIVHAAAEYFRSNHHGLQLAVRSGYFDARPGSPHNAEVIESINAFAPDILIVGMGMPRQEEWLLDNHRGLNATVLFPIGALADYVAGAIPTPPRWTGRWGLEWLFRLVTEPRRLGRRYLLEPWTLVWPLTVQFLRQRRSHGSGKHQ